MVVREEVEMELEEQGEEIDRQKSETWGSEMLDKPEHLESRRLLDPKWTEKTKMGKKIT